MKEIQIEPVNSKDADFLFCLMNNEVILSRLHEVQTNIEDWRDAIRVREGDAERYKMVCNF